LLEGKQVLLGVCGGIAAYKSCDLARMLMKEGAEVQCILTPNAADFVSALTFQALTGKPALVHEFPEQPADGMDDPFRHLNTTRDADLLLICPATANTIAKLASGIADNLLCSTYLAADCPVASAPAMNLRMWEHPSTQENIARLKANGVIVIDPAQGELACGDLGSGRLADLRDIVSEVASTLLCSKEASTGEGELSGKRFVVTAGGTREYLDPVRFITNASSGKLAFDVTDALLAKGADVELVDTGIKIPAHIRDRLAAHHQAYTAYDMLNVLSRIMPDANGLVMFAAVADYSPASYSATKRKKDGGVWAVEFSETPDVLATIASQRKAGQLLAGVALEDTDWLKRSVNKTGSKSVDVLLAVELGTNLPFGDQNINCALVGQAEALTAPKLRSKPEAAERVELPEHSTTFNGSFTPVVDNLAFCIISDRQRPPSSAGMLHGRMNRGSDGKLVVTVGCGTDPHFDDMSDETAVAALDNELLRIVSRVFGWSIEVTS